MKALSKHTCSLYTHTNTHTRTHAHTHPSPQATPHPFSSLGLQCLLVLLLLKCLPHLHDTSVLDEEGQVKGRLLDTPLSLEVLALEAPVAGDGDRVPGRLYNTGGEGVGGVRSEVGGVRWEE